MDSFLVSFAISLASGIATDLFKGRSESKVDSEIKKAFNLALKEWTPNETVRRRAAPELRKEIEQIIKNPDKLNRNSQFYDFYMLFNKRIVEYPNAYNYISSIRTMEQYKNETSKPMDNKKVFISHSSLDSQYVEKIIDTLENIGLTNDQIFCSSFEGYGVKLGKDFLEVIKSELNDDVFVLFVLSSNFYASAVSLCEMGATWIKTNNHIPILIPPFEYKDVKGVIPTTNGMKINEKAKLNSLKEVIEDYFSLTPIALNVWERKRDNVLKEIKQLLAQEIHTDLEANEPFIEKIALSQDLSFYSGLDSKIKELSAKEWPNDFEMQLDYIQNQKNAIEKLKSHKPIDIGDDKFQLIREKARIEWPDDFEMQLDTEQRQVESLRRLNAL